MWQLKNLIVMINFCCQETNTAELFIDMLNQETLAGENSANDKKKKPIACRKYYIF